MKFKHYLEAIENDDFLLCLNSSCLAQALEIPEVQAKYFIAKRDWQIEQEVCCCEECMCGQDLDDDLLIEYQSEEQAEYNRKFFDSQRFKQDLNNIDKVKRNKGIEVIIDDGGISKQLRSEVYQAEKSADYKIDEDYPSFQLNDLPMKKAQVGFSTKLGRNSEKKELELGAAIGDVLNSDRFSPKVKDKVLNASCVGEVRDIIINSEKKKNKAIG